jgi:hypothetical protein
VKLDHIATIIVSQELDTIVATTLDGKSKLDYFQGTPEDVAAYLVLANESLPGPFVVEAFVTDKAKVRGVKSVTTTPFRWTLPGIQAEQRRVDPMANAPRVERVETVTVPDVESIRQAAKAEANATIAQHDAERLKAEVEALREAVESDDDDDTDDDDEQPLAAPPWWADGEQVVTVAERIMGMVRPLLVKDAPRVPQAESITDDERRLLEAARRMKATAPDVAKDVFDQLLNNFGDNGTSDKE